VLFRSLNNFENVLCLTVSSKLSGAFNSALQAREMVQSPEKIFILDSLNAGPGQALLTLKAIELIQEQREIKEVVEELKKEIPKIRLYGAVEDPRWVANLGRATKSQAHWIKRMKKLKIHPIIKLKKGVLTKGGLVFAWDPAEALFKKIMKESKKARKKGKKIRVIIGHVDNLFQAEKLKKLLKGKIKAEIPFLTMEPEIIAVGAGPGALIVGWSPLEN
jgi:DegV family protein with EDD domain